MSCSSIISYIGNEARVKFDGGYLKQDKITFTHGKTVNIYIVYEIYIVHVGNKKRYFNY